MSRYINLTGQTIGTLKVLELKISAEDEREDKRDKKKVHSDARRGRSWLCLCDETRGGCGRTVTHGASALMNGRAICCDVKSELGESAGPCKKAAIERVREWLSEHRPDRDYSDTPAGILVRLYSRYRPEEARMLSDVLKMYWRPEALGANKATSDKRTRKLSHFLEPLTISVDDSDYGDHGPFADPIPGDKNAPVHEWPLST
jgi:hypothetical protein